MEVETPIPQITQQIVGTACAKHWIVNTPGVHQCPVCLSSINEGEAVATCHCDAGTHGFHRHCLQPWLARARSCPQCQKKVGIYQGTQPLETGDYMAVESVPFALAGFQCPTLTIRYSIHNGIQKAGHPNPGQEYFGTIRTAYLPFNSEGIETLRLLRIAWDNGCIFKVGTSLTTGAEDVVCWGIIPHKTVPNSDINQHIEYGFPDATYFDRVRYACNNLGIF